MLAELIPVEEGFVLLLTQTAGGGQVTPLVYRLADADALYALAERWCALREEDAPGTCLYEREEAYDLAVFPLGLLTAARRRLLAEYGRLQGSGEAAAAYCAEHGCLLAAGDALGKLLLKESVPAAPTPEDPLH